MIKCAKFVVLLFPLGLQGKIWQAILQSQGISVIWESPDIQFLQSIQHLQKTHATLPDLLLLDTRLQPLRPYALCRWCRDRAPELKVILCNGGQTQIITAEKQWAMAQGAAELMPRFQQDALISNAVVRIQPVLKLLDCPYLDHRALVSALLKIKRARGK
ncbi:MAG: hypothetical protein AAFY67_12520 [Cyanobacteria bacterium J06642_9]